MRQRIRQTLRAALFLLVLVVGGGSFAVWYGTPLPPAQPNLDGGFGLHKINVDSRSRTFWTYVPQNAKTDPALVFVLHGSSQNGRHMRQMSSYRFDQLAEEYGFLVVYAEGWSRGGAFGLTHEWNGCRKAPNNPAHIQKVDDTKFLLTIVDRLAASHGANKDRIFAAGFSNGGQMVFRLLSEAPDRIKAGAAMVAQMPVPTNMACPVPDQARPVLVMNGTDDPIVPYKGGEASFYGFGSAGFVSPMEETLGYWAELAGAEGPYYEVMPDPDGEDSTVASRTIYRGGAGEVVVGYTIDGGGHTFPGGWQYAPPFLVGRISGDFHAADEIVSFFIKHGLLDTADTNQLLADDPISGS